MLLKARTLNSRSKKMGGSNVTYDKAYQYLIEEKKEKTLFNTRICFN